MIHLPNKAQNPSPDRLLNPTAVGKIKNATDTFDGEACRGYYKHNSITDLLRAFSVGKNYLEQGDKPKCYYCESNIEKGVTLQVEHYRPKAKVEAIDNNNFEHHGYYWLGLEWTNLLLSCPKCNGRSAKGNRFPIKGRRAIPIEPFTGLNILDRTMCYADGNPLLFEEPLLLNPEVDHPETCLTFDTQSYMYGYGEDAIRGVTSRDILKLDRDPLIEARQDVRNCFINDINEDIGGFKLGILDENSLVYNFKKICKKIRKRRHPDQEFSLWGRYMNDNFEVCIVDFIDPEFKERLSNAFQEVINEE